MRLSPVYRLQAAKRSVGRWTWKSPNSLTKRLASPGTLRWLKTSRRLLVTASITTTQFFPVTVRKLLILLLLWIIIIFFKVLGQVSDKLQGMSLSSSLRAFSQAPITPSLWQPTSAMNPKHARSWSRTRPRVTEWARVSTSLFARTLTINSQYLSLRLYSQCLSLRSYSLDLLSVTHDQLSFLFSLPVFCSGNRHVSEDGCDLQLQNRSLFL